MSNERGSLSERDHQNMDAFLGHILDDFKSGQVTKQQVIGGLVQMISAIDIGNHGEARNWFEQGRKMVAAAVR